MNDADFAILRNWLVRFAHYYHAPLPEDVAQDAMLAELERGGDWQHTANYWVKAAQWGALNQISKARLHRDLDDLPERHHPFEDRLPVLMELSEALATEEGCWLLAVELSPLPRPTPVLWRVWIHRQRARLRHRMEPPKPSQAPASNAECRRCPIKAAVALRALRQRVIKREAERRLNHVRPTGR